MPLDTEGWRSYLGTEHLYGEQWLLCYEVNVKGWLNSKIGVDYVGGDANFRWLRDIGVQFYDIDKASSVGPPRSEAIDWVVDLEHAIHARRDPYGGFDDDLAAEDGDVTDLSLDVKACADPSTV